MQSSSHKDFSVYEFNLDDDEVEPASRRMVLKYGASENANKRGNIQQTEINDVFGVDFNGNSCDNNFNACGTYAVGTSERNFALQEETSGLVDIVAPPSTNNDKHVNTSQDNFHVGNLIPGHLRMASTDLGSFGVGTLSLHRERLDCLHPEFPSDQEMITDEEGSMETSSLSNSASDIAENEGAIDHPIPDHCCSGYEDMEKEKYTEIIVFPDYVLYRDRLTTHSRLTFSSDCIEFEDLNAFGRNESFNIKWEIDDVIHIESQWCQTIQTCLVTLRLRPDNLRSSSGVEKFTCAVNDPDWRDKELIITSFASRLKDKWNTMLDGLKEQDDFMGQHCMFFLKRSFTNFNEPFEDVVYPKGDPDAVSISKRDVELLQPETFVNDTIIDFYIKYLKNKIPPEDKHRFHFFNSFFFRKLADLDKDPGSASEGKAAFQRVRKWTRKVNIFEKDYIIVPVNYSLHWSLIVICHLGEMANFRDEGVDKAHKVPCILHMDSIKGSHNGLKNLIQSYLCEEWKARHEEASEDISPKFSNLRFVSLELPQQENSFDCGLFLLHYVELFLEDAPVNFNPFKITKLCNFLSMDWFPPAEASHKRTTIQKLIYELLDEQHKKIPSATCNDHCRSSKEDDTEKEHAVEFLSEQCSSVKKACLDILSLSTNGGTEKMELPSLPVVQHDKGSGNVLPDFLERGAIASSSSDEDLQLHIQIASFKTHDGALPPMEEDAETGQFGHSDKSDHQAPSRITDEPCAGSCSVKDTKASEMTCSQEILTQLREDQNADPSSESSTSMHLNSSEIGGNDHVLPPQNGHYMECIEQEEMDKQRSGSPEICGNIPNSPTSVSTEKLEEVVVEDSQEGDCEEVNVIAEEVVVEDSVEGDCQEVNAIAESKESGDSFFSCQENLPASSQDIESTETENISVNDTLLSRTHLEDRSEHQAHKRIKLEPVEVERRRTRSCVVRDPPS